MDFFVTMQFRNSELSWMRSCPGTTSLGFTSLCFRDHQSDQNSVWEQSTTEVITMQSWKDLMLVVSKKEPMLNHFAIQHQLFFLQHWHGCCPMPRLFWPCLDLLSPFNIGMAAAPGPGYSDPVWICYLPSTLAWLLPLAQVILALFFGANGLG